jgi:hypothetical protein
VVAASVLVVDYLLHCGGKIPVEMNKIKKKNKYKY